MGAAQIIEFLLLLLIAASLIAIATLRFRVPYTIALVVGGILIDIFHVPITELLGEGGSARVLTPDVIFMVFLPGLLFEAGLNIQVQRLRRNLVPILLLAIAGVLLATLVTGYAIHWAYDVPLLVALVFGSLISATDPISVLALFKEMGVSKRLSTLVEAESLFNDGTAVVLFQILLAGVATGELSVVDGLGRFLFVALGGGALGVGLGYLVSKLTAQLDDARIEITLTTILAYGSFLAAEHLHVSGVIATVGAGLMIGNFGAPSGMSSRTRVALWSFWEYLGFVINSLVFLLIGIEVHVADLIDSWDAILIAITTVLLGRLVAVYSLTPLANRFVEPISRSWQHVLFWGGIHGGVSMALALMLAPDFPYRRSILAMTFGVVAFSIIVQGLSIKPLMRWLGIQMGEEDEYDRVKVRQMALSSAQDELEELHRGHVISAPVYGRLKAELQERIKEVLDRIESLHLEESVWADEETKVARAQLITAEKTAIQRAINEGLISLHTGEEMLARADDELDDVTGGPGVH
jgi:CPA1 family monovalent cation:H+ antiporter